MNAALAAGAPQVFQPDVAHWPDNLCSFEAFASIEVGRKHYPEVPEDNWVAIDEAAIQDAEVFES